ncbi:MAG: cation:proton antiporter [Acidimicrobiales bacterium]|nr:cation:proton antiporter [Acidimicrobiales bacterium]
MTAHAATTVLAATGGETARILLELGLVFLVLAALSRGASRLGLSAIPAFLLVGLVLRDGGPFDLTVTDEFLEVGSQIGIVLLLLLLGLEYTPDELVGSLRSSARAGVVDLVLNATPGVVVGLLLGWSLLGAVFLGGITYISSSGIVAKLLNDLGRMGNRETPSVLAVLVIEDLVMALYLPIVTGLAIGGALAGVAVSVVVAVAVVGLTLFLAVRHEHLLGRVVFSRSDEVLLWSLLGLALVVAGAAELLNVSAAVGAFLVGIAVSGAAARTGSTVLAPLRDLFAGVFFVVFTFTIEPGEIVDALPVAIGLAVLTAVTKTVTGAWAARRAGVAARGQIRAGTVLVARGEFSIVIAGLATASAVQDGLAALATSYVLVLAVAGPLLTRFADPAASRVLARRTRRATARAAAAAAAADAERRNPADEDAG